MNHIKHINELFFSRKIKNTPRFPDKGEYDLFTNKEYLEDILLPIEDEADKVDWKIGRSNDGVNYIQVNIKWKSIYNWINNLRKKEEILVPFGKKLNKLGYLVRVTDYGYGTHREGKVDMIVDIVKKESVDL